MPMYTDIWKMLAGVAIFLLGMYFLEDGLRSLVGRPFKIFLKKQTSSQLKGILGGAVVTAVLQSSSIVNLMVLAFAGAGVIQMQNALAIMLGSNLGTTISSWIIATVGFQYNIENFTLPLAGISGMLLMMTNRESRFYQWCKMLFGFSFLFVGLGFIRAGIDNAVLHLDISRWNDQPAIVFVLAGLVITSLVQASSATVAIVLSALHADAVTLYAATAIVLGAEVGTTIKLILAAAKGIAVKKRVALGNLLFNIITTVLIFIFLAPINYFITVIVGMKDNLLALVFFQSFVNLAGIILFYPFLGIFGRFLEKRFRNTDNDTLFIHKVKVADTDLAMIALEKETGSLIDHVIRFTLQAFDKNAANPQALQITKDFEEKKLMEKYDYIKHLHGEIHHYSLQLQNASPGNDPMARIGQLISAARNSMYAAKNIKDALPDIEQLKRSSNDLKYNFYVSTGEKVTAFAEQIISLLLNKNTAAHFEGLHEIFKSVQQSYRHTLKQLYHEGIVQHLNEVEFSTILNFNREIYTYEKSILFALKDQLLTDKQAASFDELPGFIR